MLEFLCRWAQLCLRYKATDDWQRFRNYLFLRVLKIADRRFNTGEGNGPDRTLPTLFGAVKRVAADILDL
jgi:hypothetical protein